MAGALHNRFWAAPPGLAHHLTWIWRLTGRPEGPFPALPDVASAHVILQLGPPLSMHAAGVTTALPPRVVVGAFDGLRQLLPGPVVDNVGLSLPPWCACLVGSTAPALRGELRPLVDLAPGLDAALHRWAEQPLSFPALVAALEAHLHPRCDALVHRAVAGLDGGESVSALATRLGLSRRQLTRRFEASVGMPPREYLRRLRFTRSWQAAAAGPDASWAEIAARAEYADQPHLAREYRTMVGAPPSAVFPHGSPVQARRG